MTRLRGLTVQVTRMPSISSKWTRGAMHLRGRHDHGLHRLEAGHRFERLLNLRERKAVGNRLRHRKLPVMSSCDLDRTIEVAAKVYRRAVDAEVHVVQIAWLDRCGARGRPQTNDQVAACLGGELNTFAERGNRAGRFDHDPG